MSGVVESWSLADVSNWLRRIGLGVYADLFCKHEINGEILLTMGEKDLSSSPLNISTFGHLRKFGIEIEKLKNGIIPPNMFADRGFGGGSPFETAPSRLMVSPFDNAPSLFEQSAAAIEIPMETVVSFPFFESRQLTESPKLSTPSVVEKPDAAANGTEILNVSVVSVENRAVMMKGTLLDYALEMEKEQPDFCWRYQNVTDSIKQLERADGIYAEAVIVISPAEMYLQPHVLVNQAKKLLEKMNAFYTDDYPPVSPDRIFEKMPCAVRYKEDDGWYRAVVQEKGLYDARVVFVDWGNSQFTEYDNIKPLTMAFGKFPPLAVRCRIEGVRERALEQKVIRSFLDEISNLNMQVKFVPVSYADEIVTVRLYNPTTNEDIGLKYIPHDPLIPPSNAELDEKIRQIHLREAKEKEEDEKLRREIFEHEEQREKLRRQQEEEEEERLMAEETEAEHRRRAEVERRRQAEEERRRKEADEKSAKEFEERERRRIEMEEKRRRDDAEEKKRQEEEARREKQRKEAEEKRRAEEDKMKHIEEYNRRSMDILEQMKAKAAKMEEGFYKSDMEAFLDGAPGFDEADSDDEDVKPKGKSLKQIKRDLFLKTQGKPSQFVDRELVFLDNGIEYVKDYPKQSKPPKGEVEVYVCKVISAREVYLRSALQKNNLQSINNLFRTLYDEQETISLPDYFIKTGMPCAYKDSDGRWYRGRIGEIGPADQDLPVILVDYGRVVTVRRTDRDRLRALRARTYLTNEFQIYKCKINKLCDPPTTAVESDLLKDILPEGKQFAAFFDRDREPWRVRLEYSDTTKDFNEDFEREMAERNLHQKSAQQRCSRFDVVLHQPNDYNEQKFAEVSAKFENKQHLNVVTQTSSSAAERSSFSNGAVGKTPPKPFVAAKSSPLSFITPTRLLQAPVASTVSKKPTGSTSAAVEEDEDEGPDVEIIDGESDDD